MNPTQPIAISAETSSSEDKKTKEDKASRSKEEEKENRRRKSATFSWLHPFFRRLGQKQDDADSNIDSEKNKEIVDESKKEDKDVDNPEGSDLITKRPGNLNRNVRMRHSTSFEHRQSRHSKARSSTKADDESSEHVPQLENVNRDADKSENVNRDTDTSSIMKASPQQRNIKIRHSTSFDSRASRRNKSKKPENVKVEEEMPQYLKNEYHRRQICYTNSLSKDEVFQRLMSWKKVTNRTHSGSAF